MGMIDTYTRRWLFGTLIHELNEKLIGFMNLRGYLSYPNIVIQIVHLLLTEVVTNNSPGIL